MSPFRRVRDQAGLDGADERGPDRAHVAADRRRAQYALLSAPARALSAGRRRLRSCRCRLRPAISRYVRGAVPRWSISSESTAVGVAVPLRIGRGELSRTLVLVIALTAHLLLGASLCLGDPTLVRWQTPFADQSACSGESAEHKTPSLSRNQRSLCRPYA